MMKKFTPRQAKERAKRRAEWKARILSSIDPERTALAIIDVQKDFCSASGAIANLGYDVSPCSAVAKRIRKSLPGLRELVGQVFFFRLVYDPSKMSFAQKERLLRKGKPIICNRAGSGTNLHLLNPIAGDRVFKKYRYSAFSVKTFVNLLKARDISTVVVAGVDTHICIEGSVRHGYDLGYRMIVLSDAVATHKADHREHLKSLKRMDTYFSLAAPTSDFIGYLAKYRRANSENHK